MKLFTSELVVIFTDIVRLSLCNAVPVISISYSLSKYFRFIAKTDQFITKLLIPCSEIFIDNLIAVHLVNIFRVKN